MTAPDRVSASVGYTIAIPGTYSNFKVEMTYETAVGPEDEGDPQKALLRARTVAKIALEREREKMFKRLGLDEGGAPLKKDTVKWRST